MRSASETRVVIRGTDLRDGDAPRRDGGPVRQEPRRRATRPRSPSRSAGSAASWPRSSARSIRNLDPWQIVQVSRHQQRPQTRDYLELIFEQFLELHGDRAFGDDQAIVTGLAHLDDLKVMFVGHQKGKNLAERTGLPLRLRPSRGLSQGAGEDAARRPSIGLPIISFIDTPGAYPGITAEERGQAAIIAENLLAMSQIRSPIVCVVIGEGGSGGALGHRHRRSSGDARVHLLLGHHSRGVRLDPLERERARPQGRGRAQDDQPRPAPLRHRRRGDPRAAGRRRTATIARPPPASRPILIHTVRQLKDLSIDELLDRRYDKYRKIGVFLEVGPASATPLEGD